MPDTAKRLRIALCQINTTVGDIEGNAKKIRDYIERSYSQGAQLTIFPELALSGYPPEDLLLKTSFVEANRQAIEELAREINDLVALVGFPELDGDVYNSLAVLSEGEIKGSYRKVFLPNYGVFDEQRYFRAGDAGAVCNLGDFKIGLTVCEDIWEPGPPATDESQAGAELIVNISASPYHQGKGTERERMLSQRARDNLSWVAFCNLVGGQDELVFDGHSLIFDVDGEVVARGRQFEEELVVCDIEPKTATSKRLRDTRQREASRRTKPRITSIGPVALSTAPPEGEPPGEPATLLDGDEEVYRALLLGIRDYVSKNGFRGVLVGLSGGIDSALVATLASDALGGKNVRVVIMPSPYSSEETQRDARKLAENLGLTIYELPIEETMQAFAEILAGPFGETEEGVAEENIQARIRGTFLMALSNKFGWLVLTTGNKSELSVGYATLYGDMAGGFAVIKDVPKTLVYRLARYRNSRGDDAPIPESIITRLPSAELKPDQLDQDTLPPYDMLDPILEAYVEQDQARDQMIQAGFEPELVDSVIAMVDHAEYKRRQAPPGIKIRPKAFGRDRRLPITNRFSG